MLWIYSLMKNRAKPIQILKFKLPKIEIDREAIKAFLRTDRGILLISMCISLLFWLLVKLSQNYKANREVALNYNLPEEMSFVNIPPEKVRVTLEGRGWDLMYNYFEGANTEISFDLTNTILQNITNNRLKDKMTENLSSNKINVVDMNFDYISIELGENTVKRVPITLEQEITLAPEHQYQASIKLVPDSVNIYGPASLVQAYENWPTTLLVLNNIKNTIERPILLQPSDKVQIKLSESVITVQIPVEQFTEKSIFLPVTVKNAPDSLKVFPNKVKTSFVVGLSRYDTISEKDFQLEVDLKGIPINQANNTAPILLTKSPKEVKNIRFSPNSVHFLFVKDN